MKRLCEARFLGRVAYADASRLQDSLVRSLAEGAGPEALLLLEHPHVVTLGRGADAAHVLLDEATRAARGIGVHETGRGGDVTYHGPGQLVGYPILDLRPDRCDVHRYVRELEEVLIRTAADFGVEAGRVAGRTGVWSAGRKIGAIGVRVSHWITSHGFAFNVTTDLAYFDHIVPCGLADARATSLLEETGRAFTLDEVARSAAHHFGRVFDREMTGFAGTDPEADPAARAARHFESAPDGRTTEHARASAGSGDPLDRETMGSGSAEPASVAGLRRGAA